ncbi:Cerato-platanin [Tylopilus felleus]
MHHLSTLLISVLAFVSGLGVLAQASTLSYDNNYDNGALSLDSVACSSGQYGLETKNSSWTTLGSLPNFPNVGGVDTVSGWNSPQCGTCYAVTYAGTGITVNILAVDKSQSGFTVSQAAMNTLTNGQAVQFGRVSVSYTQVDPSVCGV